MAPWPRRHRARHRGRFSRPCCRTSPSRCSTVTSRRRGRHARTTSARVTGRKGRPSYRMIRYADDFVVLVRGTEAQAHAIKEQTAEFMAEQMRLTLSPEKTAITHVDDGFDLLGFRIKRRPWRRRQARRLHVPKRTSAARGHAPHQDADQTQHDEPLARRADPRAQPHPARMGQLPSPRREQRCFAYLSYYLWWRVIRWLRKKYPRLTWKQIRRRCWGRHWTSRRRHEARTGPTRSR